MVALDDLIKSTLSELDNNSFLPTDIPGSPSGVKTPAKLPDLADTIWDASAASNSAHNPDIQKLHQMLDRIAASFGDDFDGDDLPAETVHTMTRALASELESELKSLVPESSDPDHIFEEVNNLVRDLCDGDEDVINSAMSLLRKQ